MFSSFLRIVDAVTAGEKEIPEVTSTYDLEGSDEHEHTHGEDEYCPDCEHQR